MSEVHNTSCSFFADISNSFWAILGYEHNRVIEAIYTATNTERGCQGFQSLAEMFWASDCIEQCQIKRVLNSYNNECLKNDMPIYDLEFTAIPDLDFIEDHVAEVSNIQKSKVIKILLALYNLTVTGKIPTYDYLDPKSFYVNNPQHKIPEQFEDKEGSNVAGNTLQDVLIYSAIGLGLYLGGDFYLKSKALS